MTQVDLGLTAAGQFDSADSIISINNTNKKPGASHLITGSNKVLKKYRVAILTILAPFISLWIVFGLTIIVLDGNLLVLIGQPNSFTVQSSEYLGYSILFLK
jgi:hypothetical protein